MELFGSVAFRIFTVSMLSDVSSNAWLFRDELKVVSSVADGAMFLFVVRGLLLSGVRKVGIWVIDAVKL